MKERLLQNTVWFAVGVVCLLAFASQGCRNDINAPPSSSPDAAPQQPQPFAKAGSFGLEQTNLVADVSSLGAKRVDVSLMNAWGIALSPTGIFWISANHSSVAVVYNKDGNTVRPPVKTASSQRGTAVPTRLW